MLIGSCEPWKSVPTLCGRGLIPIINMATHHTVPWHSLSDVVDWGLNRRHESHVSLFIIVLIGLLSICWYIFILLITIFRNWRHELSPCLSPLYFVPPGKPVYAKHWYPKTSDQILHLCSQIYGLMSKLRILYSDWFFRGLVFQGTVGSENGLVDEKQCYFLIMKETI